jgi:predicted transcriptional regulator
VAAALTDEQIERLHLEYAQTGRLRAAARVVGVSPSTAKRYIDQERANPDSVLEQVRTQKRIDIAEKIAEVQIVILEALKSPEKIAKASYQELSTSYGILTDKHQLITGQATERHEHRDIDTSRDQLARRIDELADRRRAKQSDSRVETA